MVQQLHNTFTLKNIDNLEKNLLFFVISNIVIFLPNIFSSDIFSYHQKQLKYSSDQVTLFILYSQGDNKIGGQTLVST